MKKLSFEDLPEAISGMCQDIIIIKSQLELIGKSQEESEDIFLNIDQASELINLSQSGIYGHVSKNTIPHIKKGKRLYFLKQDLINWILQGKRKTKVELEEYFQNRLIKINKG